MARYLKTIETTLELLEGKSGDYEWLRGSVARGFWSNPVNRRRWMDWMGFRMGYKSQEDWYSLTARVFEENYGHGLLHYYRKSPINALKEYMPEVEWQEWRLSCVPKRFWRNPENRRRFMCYLGKEKEYENPDDWYKVTTDDFYRHNGGGMLVLVYNGSVVEAVKDYMPNHPWLEWKFASCPKGFWKNRKHRCRYLKWLLEELELSTYEDYYKLRQAHFGANYGAGMLHYWAHSPAVALRECFPAHDWLEWRFGATTAGFWHSVENRRAYLSWLGKRLGFERPDDYYLLTTRDVKENCGAGLIAQYGQSAWKLVVSNIENASGWDTSKFGHKTLTKRQRHLYLITKMLFADRDVHYNFKPVELRFSNGYRMELDIFVPPNLAIEYQGEQHFYVCGKNRSAGEDGLRKVMQYDEEKRQACALHGITLIEIDYHWDGTVEAVVNALRAANVLPKTVGT